MNIYIYIDIFIIITIKTGNNRFNIIKCDSFTGTRIIVINSFPINTGYTHMYKHHRFNQLVCTIVRNYTQEQVRYKITY